MTVRCVLCDSHTSVQEMDLPYIFVHLVSQLAAVNIKLKVDTRHT